MGTRARISRRSSIWSKSPFQGALAISSCRDLLEAAPTAGDCAGPGEVGAVVAEDFAGSAERAHPGSKTSTAAPPTATITLNRLLTNSLLTQEETTRCRIAHYILHIISDSSLFLRLSAGFSHDLRQLRDLSRDQLRGGHRGIPSAPMRPCPLEI